MVGGDRQAELLQAGEQLAKSRPKVPHVLLRRQRHHGDGQPDEDVGEGQGDDVFVEPLLAQLGRLQDDGDQDCVGNEDHQGEGELENSFWCFQ